MKATRSGFTLVEMMITVAVIAIIGVIATPAIFSQIPKYRVDSATKALASEVQLARMRAISRNRVHYATFDAASTPQTIKIEELDASGNRQTVKTIDVGAQFPNVSLGYNAVTGIDGTAVSKAVAFGTGLSVGSEATLLPSGLLAASGLFYLIPTGDMGTGKLDRIRAVQIGLTGNVTLYRYKAGASPPWEAY
jgi:prepilin-type N-terminal cleavage/methylation domain-containing protein